MGKELIIDRLIEKTIECKNPSVAGIDTAFDYLPDSMTKACKTLADVGKAILDFNIKIIDEIANIVPAVKVQIAYYEMYGIEGMKAFLETIEYAKSKGLVVISDIKRNDIGSTASCYSNAYLGKVNVNGQEFSPFESDFITVNGYLGSDGINPFLSDCKRFDKGMFVLVKTSNPSSGEFQNKVFDDGQMLYESMADKVTKWGAELIGKHGYSSVGGVIGATKPQEAEKVRNSHKSMYFLVPGYGAQGGTADDLVCCFDDRCLGAIVNSSRGILCAYKQEKYKGKTFEKAAYDACLDMKEDIVSSLAKVGKKF